MDGDGREGSSESQMGRDVIQDVRFGWWPHLDDDGKVERVPDRREEEDCLIAALDIKWRGDMNELREILKRKVHGGGSFKS